MLSKVYNGVLKETCISCKRATKVHHGKRYIFQYSLCFSCRLGKVYGYAYIMERMNLENLLHFLIYIHWLFFKALHTKIYVL